MLYRIKQFLTAVFAQVTEEDIAFTRKYLREQEWELFSQLRLYEQRHCIDVAQKLKELSKGDTEMIRLGLLHDIGKIQYPLNPLEKSMIVILDKVTQGKIKKYRQCKMVKCYYEHPQLGYELLKQTNDYEEDFLKRIQNHHRQTEEEKLLQLQQCDDLS